jgi:hypothetical protein
MSASRHAPKNTLAPHETGDRHDVPGNQPRDGWDATSQLGHHRPTSSITRAATARIASTASRQPARLGRAGNGRRLAEHLRGIDARSPFRILKKDV